MNAPPFSLRVREGMRRQGYTLRSFCRAVGLDPSFFSKVLAGKRSPPSEEAVLRKIAQLLDLNAAEMIVSAGRIPLEWQALWRDPALFKDMHGLASQGPGWRATEPYREPLACAKDGSRRKDYTIQEVPPPKAVRKRSQDLAEELL